MSCIARYGRKLFDPGPIYTSIKVSGRPELRPPIKEELTDMPNSKERYGRRLFYTERWGEGIDAIPEVKEAERRKSEWAVSQ